MNAHKSTGDTRGSIDCGRANAERTAKLNESLGWGKNHTNPHDSIVMT